MGWTDTGFMGSSYYETPNLDLLSELGMVFTNGYASAANCAPSRANLMTGKWSQRHGIYTVGSSERGRSIHRKIIPTKNTTILDSSHIILPEILQQYGYKTIHSGKWHLSNNPLEYGFDINIGGGKSGNPGSYYPPYKNLTIEKGKHEYLTDLIMEKTLASMDSMSNPFFINYSPYAVHTPIQAAPNLLEKYEQKEPSSGHNNAAYASMIENLDRNVGLLISKLKEKRIFDNTLIVFTSDNGGLFGITEQKPLRAGKGAYYEGGIRTPFFFVWKDHIPANTESEVPITNLDIFPTIVEALNSSDQPETEFDGENILPILKGEKNTLERPLFWHFPIYLQAYNPNYNENRDSLFRTRPGSVVRQGDWKLHYYFEDNAIELYNLKDDISEQKNLSKSNPQKADELLTLLKQWWKDTNAPIPNQPNPQY
jgi:arylsulfatase A-like enzyme